MVHTEGATLRPISDYIRMPLLLGRKNLHPSHLDWAEERLGPTWNNLAPDTRAGWRYLQVTERVDEAVHE